MADLVGPFESREGSLCVIVLVLFWKLPLMRSAVLTSRVRHHSGSSELSDYNPEDFSFTKMPRTHVNYKLEY
jgi:hypothetical protein